MYIRLNEKTTQRPWCVLNYIDLYIIQPNNSAFYYERNHERNNSNETKNEAALERRERKKREKNPVIFSAGTMYPVS